MITVSGLTKKYGDRTVVDDVLVHARAGHGHRLPRPERRRQDDDDADDHRPGRRRPPASRAGRRPAVRRAAQPGRRHGHPARRRRRAPGPHRPHAPAAAGRDRSASRPAAWTRCSALVGLGRRRAPADRRLLAGHAAAARHRRGAAGRPAGADVRRAGQRAGPGGHPLDARPAARARRPRRDGAALEPPARRGRAHRRPAAGDRQRPDRRRRARSRELLGAEGTARPGRRPGRVRPRAARRPGSTCSTAPTASPARARDRSVEQVGAVAAAGGHVLVDLRPQQRALEDLFFSLTTRHDRRPDHRPAAAPRGHPDDRAPVPAPPADRPAPPSGARPPRCPPLVGLEIRKSLSTRSGRSLAAAAVVLPSVGRRAGGARAATPFALPSGPIGVDGPVHRAAAHGPRASCRPRASGRTRPCRPPSCSCRSGAGCSRRRPSRSP